MVKVVGVTYRGGLAGNTRDGKCPYIIRYIYGDIGYHVTDGEPAPVLPNQSAKTVACKPMDQLNTRSEFTSLAIGKHTQSE